MSKISEEDAEMLALKLARALQQARSVSDSEHYDHHRWITERIKSAEASRQFWQDMHKHAIKWGMISVFTGIGYAIWLGIKAILHINGNGS